MRAGSTPPVGEREHAGSVLRLVSPSSHRRPGRGQLPIARASVSIVSASRRRRLLVSIVAPQRRGLSRLPHCDSAVAQLRPSRCAAPNRPLRAPRAICGVLSFTVPERVSVGRTVARLREPRVSIQMSGADDRRLAARARARPADRCRLPLITEPLRLLGSTWRSGGRPTRRAPRAARVPRAATCQQRKRPTSGRGAGSPI